MESETQHVAAPTSEIITVTPAAAEKIKELLKKDHKEGYGLRISVAGGGCAGFSYATNFEEKPRETDTVAESHGIKVFVPQATVPLVQGMTFDYVESLDESGFKITNPNATSSCGCGKSFGA